MFIKCVILFGFLVIFSAVLLIMISLKGDKSSKTKDEKITKKSKEDNSIKKSFSEKYIASQVKIPNNTVNNSNLTQVERYFLDDSKIIVLYDAREPKVFDIKNPFLGWKSYFTNSFLQRENFYANIDKLTEISKEKAKELIFEAKIRCFNYTIAFLEKEECCKTLFRFNFSRFFSITMARILCEMGFVVHTIALGGYRDSHMWEADYYSSYDSIEEFKEKAINDYVNLCSESDLTWNWTNVSVTLYNSEGIAVHFYCDEYFENACLVVQYKDREREANDKLFKKICEDITERFKKIYNDMELCTIDNTLFDKNEYSECPYCSNNLKKHFFIV